MDKSSAPSAMFASADAILVRWRLPDGNQENHGISFKNMPNSIAASMRYTVNVFVVLCQPLSSKHLHLNPCLPRAKIKSVGPYGQGRKHLMRLGSLWSGLKYCRSSIKKSLFLPPRRKKLRALWTISFCQVCIFDLPSTWQPGNLKVPIAPPQLHKHIYWTLNTNPSLSIMRSIDTTQPPQKSRDEFPLASTSS